MSTDKLPDMELELRCPNCGQEERFNIAVTGIEILTNGREDGRCVDWEVESPEWEDFSWAFCRACQWEGTAGELEKAYNDARKEVTL